MPIPTLKAASARKLAPPRAAPEAAAAETPSPGRSSFTIGRQPSAREGIDYKMQTVAEILAEQGSPEAAEWEELDRRAIEAAQWADRTIASVVKEIAGRGGKNDDGQAEITFGDLFVQTDHIFDALSGILKTAKKYGVVSYVGEQLWQGKDDLTVVTVVKEHRGIQIKRRKAHLLKSAPTKAKSSGFDHGFKEGMKCFKCEKRVYQAEYVGASGKPYHKLCFRCVDCKKPLQSNEYSVSSDRNFRCPNHHTKYEQSKL